jgi:hypothetical protein
MGSAKIICSNLCKPLSKPKIFLGFPDSSGQILSLWLGDKVDSGMGFVAPAARLHRLTGRYDNPMPESAISSQSGTNNLVTARVFVGTLLQN